MKNIISIQFALIIMLTQLSAAPNKISNFTELPLLRNQLVSVEGVVSQWAYGSSYYLTDNYGNSVLVKSNKKLPKIGKCYIITGVVLDGSSPGSIEILESNRRACNMWLVVLIIVSAIILVLLIVYLAVVGKRNRIIGDDVELLTSIAETEKLPEPTMMGTTIRIPKPPEETLKMLPGYFEVVKGDDSVKIIRFYKISSNPELEFTFGREKGPQYIHYQLAHPTVSRKQAKLIYSKSGYTLINYSTTNPTKINGKEMAVNESYVLQDGDLVSMGEIELLFHAK